MLPTYKADLLDKAICRGGNCASGLRPDPGGAEARAAARRARPWLKPARGFGSACR